MSYIRKKVYLCIGFVADSFCVIYSATVSLDESGEMAERSIAAVLKTVDLRGSGGSNPSLSAERNRGTGVVPLFCVCQKEKR